MRFTLQVADQPARFVEGDGPCCPGDQCRNRSFLSWRCFVHGVPVGEGRECGGPVPFPRKCDTCDGIPEGWAFRQLCQPEPGHRLGGLRSGLVALPSLAASEHIADWPSAPSPVSAAVDQIPGAPRSPPTAQPRAAVLKVPPRYREIAVAPRVPIAKMPVCIDWRSNAKRPTQRRAALSGPPVPPFRPPPLRPWRVGGQTAIAQFRMPASARRVGRP